MDIYGNSESASTIKSLFGVMRELPRQNPFRYVNRGALDGGYFAAAERSLSDGYLYIVLSDTGSAASEIIRKFTRRRFNHASLSFDRELSTLVSYNGGVSGAYGSRRPGLNRENPERMGMKPGAAALVYALPCTYEQKLRILERVREIDREGSSYNTIGLFVGYSHKPNIMFCSQFVCNMLRVAGLDYTGKDDFSVKPHDFAELDREKRLNLVGTINLCGS